MEEHVLGHPSSVDGMVMDLVRARPEFENLQLGCTNAKPQRASQRRE